MSTSTSELHEEYVAFQSGERHTEIIEKYINTRWLPEEQPANERRGKRIIHECEDA